MRKISSEQKADIVRRIQVKNPDGTWAVTYKDIAAEFAVSSCLISHIAKHVCRNANAVRNSFHWWASDITRPHSCGICTSNCVIKWV
jgi:hypothetical protein